MNTVSTSYLLVSSISFSNMHPVQNVDSLDKRKVKPTYCQWSVGKFAEFFDQNLFNEIQISYKVRRVTSHINSVDM